MKKLLTTIIFVCTAMFPLMAQDIVPVSVTPISGIQLPWSLTNLTVVDGRLYACQNGDTIAKNRKLTIMTG